MGICIKKLNFALFASKLKALLGRGWVDTYT